MIGCIKAQAVPKLRTFARSTVILPPCYWQPGLETKVQVRFEYGTWMISKLLSCDKTRFPSIRFSDHDSVLAPRILFVLFDLPSSLLRLLMWASVILMAIYAYFVAFLG